MTGAPTLREVYNVLQAVKREVSLLKKRLLDPDAIMTAADRKAYERARRELTDGKTTSLDVLEAALGLRC